MGISTLKCSGKKIKNLRYSIRLTLVLEKIDMSTFEGKIFYYATKSETINVRHLEKKN